MADRKAVVKNADYRRNATRLSLHCHKGFREVQSLAGHYSIHKEHLKANIHISYSIIEVDNLNVSCFLMFLYLV